MANNTITYQWNITKLNCIPNYNGMSNTVSRVYWTYSGTDGTANGSMSSSTDLPLPTNANTFIDFSLLTQNVVVSWIESSSNVTNFQTFIENYISNYYNPSIIALTPPWANSVVTSAPDYLSKRQLLIGLATEGTISNTEAISAASGGVPSVFQNLINTLPPQQQIDEQITWSTQTIINRLDPLLLQLMQSVGKTQTDLDQFFLTYSKI